jgi:hypothetical protein
MGSDFLEGMMWLSTAGMIDIGKDRKKSDAAKASATQAASNQSLGNLTDEEATDSASKKMFRQGLYFTSPTGLSGSGTRGKSRLMGA